VAAPRATVPKTAVNEDSDFFNRENKVGISGNADGTDPPPPYSELGKMSANSAFCRRIICRLNRLHIAAAGWRCIELIRHNLGRALRTKVVYNLNATEKAAKDGDPNC
jgi:hypothetical protein